MGRVSGTHQSNCRENAIVCATDNNGNKAVNCYSLEGLGALGETVNSQTVTEEQLASGFVAWMLNGQGAGPWKQSIGTDKYPAFSGDSVFLQNDGSYGPCSHEGSTDKPTCTESAVCSICGEILSAAGHCWNGTVYTWTEDGNSCMASHVCRTDESHKETVLAAITKELTQAPSAESVGEVTCTATFDVDWAETKTRMVPAIGYTMRVGCDQKITAGDTAMFVSDAPFAKFRKLQVDGRDVAASDYTAQDSSTKITLKADFIKGLGIGEHTITIISADGAATTQFTVEAAGDTPEGNNPNAGDQFPQTGDNGKVFLWIALLLVCGFCMIGIIIYGKKKK